MPQGPGPTNQSTKRSPSRTGAANLSKLWLAGTVLIASSACVPTVASYLSVPVVLEQGAARALVRVPLGELAGRMRAYDPHALAFYATGRTPIPHRLLDTDGDGEPDTAALVMPVSAHGMTRLSVVCPGPKANGQPDEAGATPGAQLQFELARS